MLWLVVGPTGVCLLTFILLLCSVLFAVGSLSLLYLIVVFWFVCSGGWCVGGLGSFVQAGCLCVLVHIRVRLASLDRFGPSSGIFY